MGDGVTRGAWGVAAAAALAVAVAPGPARAQMRPPPNGRALPMGPPGPPPVAQPPVAAHRPAAPRAEGTLRGRVVDDGLGLPLALVEVTAAAVPGGRRFRPTRTDERGEFTMRLPEGQCVVLARRPLFGEGSSAVLTVRGRGPGADTAEVRLAPIARVLATVEVYRGPSETPAEFGGAASPCRVIGQWSAPPTRTR